MITLPLVQPVASRQPRSSASSPGTACSSSRRTSTRGTDWTTNEANQAPIGSGPFKFVSYEAGATVELEANHDLLRRGTVSRAPDLPDHPDPNTAGAGAAQNGEMDFVGILPNAQVADLEGNPRLQVLAPKIYPSPFYFGFNPTRAAARQPRCAHGHSAWRSIATRLSPLPWRDTAAARRPLLPERDRMGQQSGFDCARLRR